MSFFGQDWDEEPPGLICLKTRYSVPMVSLYLISKAERVVEEMDDRAAAMELEDKIFSAIGRSHTDNSAAAQAIFRKIDEDNPEKPLSPAVQFILDEEMRAVRAGFLAVLKCAPKMVREHNLKKLRDGFPTAKEALGNFRRCKGIGLHLFGVSAGSAGELEKLMDVPARFVENSRLISSTPYRWKKSPHAKEYFDLNCYTKASQDKCTQARNRLELTVLEVQKYNGTISQEEYLSRRAELMKSKKSLEINLTMKFDPKTCTQASQNQQISLAIKSIKRVPSADGTRKWEGLTATEAAFRIDIVGKKMRMEMHPLDRNDLETEKWTSVWDDDDCQVNRPTRPGESEPDFWSTEEVMDRIGLELPFQSIPRKMLDICHGLNKILHMDPKTVSALTRVAVPCPAGGDLETHPSIVVASNPTRDGGSRLFSVLGLMNFLAGAKSDGPWLCRVHSTEKDVGNIDRFDIIDQNQRFVPKENVEKEVPGVLRIVIPEKSITTTSEALHNMNEAWANFKDDLGDSLARPMAFLLRNWGWFIVTGAILLLIVGVTTNGIGTGFEDKK